MIVAAIVLVACAIVVAQRSGGGSWVEVASAVVLWLLIALCIASLLTMINVLEDRSPPWSAAAEIE